MADETKNRIEVVSPSGEFGSVPISEFEPAKALGYRIATKEESHYEGLREKYGTGVDNALKAAAQGAAKSLPFVGGFAEKLIEPDEEARTTRAEQYPGTMLGAEIVGTGAQLFVPFATPVKILARAGKAAEAASLVRGFSVPAAKAIGGITEGALFGAGQIVNEVELGQTKDLGERTAVAIGIGSIMGGLSGYAIGKAGQMLDDHAKKTIKITPEEAKKVREVKELSPDGGYKTTDSSVESSTTGYESTTRDTTTKTTTKTIKDPETPAMTRMQEVIEKTKNISRLDDDLPEYGAVVAALEEIPDLENKPADIIVESLRNDRYKDAVKGLENSQKEEGFAIRQHKALIKKEASEKLESTIINISPSNSATRDVHKAGAKVLDSFVDSYNAAKEADDELWKRFDVRTADKVKYPGALFTRLEEASPGITDYMEFDGLDGKVTLLPYRRSMPIKEEGYNAVKKMVDVVNEDGLTVGGVRNARDTLLEGIDSRTAPKGYSEASRIKKSMMDFVQDLVDEKDEALDVRELFKRYAINEQDREIIEKIFGGSISDRAKFGEGIIPEDAIGRAFANTQSVGAMKRILGKNFDDVLADYLLVNMEKYSDFDTGKFSSKKFSTFLKGKWPELEAAFESRPQDLTRISSLNTLMRMIPDAGPINPSFTSKGNELISIVNKLKHPIETSKEVVEHIKDYVEHQNRVDLFNNVKLGEQTAQAEKEAQKSFSKYISMKTIESAAHKAQKAINNGVNAIVKLPGIPQVATQIGLAATKEDKRKEYDKITEQLDEIVVNGEKSLNNLAEMAENLSQHAPEVSQSLQMTAVAQTQFLASKLPKKPDKKLFSPDYKPSDSEVSEFLHYYRALQNPMVALQDIKNGVLTKQTVEACATVYPSLYQNMCSELVSRVADSKKNIPYRTKIMISNFLNQPVEDSLNPGSILKNQESLNQGPMQRGMQPQMKPTQKGLDKLNLSDRILTPMQKSNERRNK